MKPCSLSRHLFFCSAVFSLSTSPCFSALYIPPENAYGNLHYSLPDTLPAATSELPSSTAQSLNLSLRVLPIGQRYFNRQPRTFVEESSIVSERPPRLPSAKTPAARPAPFDLSVSGAKSFAVELGPAQAVGLAQGLNLSLSGQVSPNSRLAASISDRASPGAGFQTSRRLAELDQVKVEFSSPALQATVGDFRWQAGGSAGPGWAQTLSGFKGGFTGRGWKLQAVAAATKGRWQHKSFYGQPGRQGPYLLGTGAVVPNSEKIYLNGEQLFSGSDRDYVIDYGSGSVTFTPRRPIGADVRIACDFETLEGDYPQHLYGGESEIQGLSGRARFSFDLLRAIDDRSSGFGASLTAAEEGRWGQTGQGDGLVAKSGAQRVGFGQGDYVALDSSSGVKIYRYAGPGRGDWRVSFSVVGAGKGDYLPLAGGGYQYVGYNQGTYAPIVFLPAPQGHWQISSGLAVTPLPSLSVSGQWRHTSLEPDLTVDTKSTIPGNELRFGFAWGTGTAPVQVSGNFGLREKRFQALGDSTSQIREVSWGIFGSTPEGDEHTGEFVATLNTPRVQGKLTTGLLAQSGNFAARRAGGSASLSLWRNSELHLKDEEIRGAQKNFSLSSVVPYLYRHASTAELVQRVGSWTVGAAWQQGTAWRAGGSYSGFGGERFGVLSARVDRGRTAVAVSRRQSDVHQTVWQRFSEQILATLSSGWTRRAFSGDLTYTRQLQSNHTSLPGRKSLDLALLRTAYRPSEGALAVDFFHSINQVGAGNYGERFESRELFPDTPGSSDSLTSRPYALYDSTIAGEPVPEFSQALRLEYHPRRNGSVVNARSVMGDLAQRLSADVSLSQTHREKGYGYGDLGLLAFWRKSNPAALLFGEKRAAGEVKLWPVGRQAHLFARGNLDRQQYRLFGSGLRERENHQYGMGIRGAFASKSTGEVEFYLTNKNEQSVDQLTLGLSGRGGRTNVWYYLSRTLDLNGEIKILREREQVGGAQTVFYSAAPLVRLRPLAGLSVSAQARWVAVTTQTPAAPLSFFQAEGRPVGQSWEWSVTGEWRLRTKLAGQWTVSSRKDRWFGQTTAGRAELKAYF